MIATPSPSSTPSSRSALASALERACVSREGELADLVDDRDVVGVGDRGRGRAEGRRGRPSARSARPRAAPCRAASGGPPRLGQDLERCRTCRATRPHRQPRGDGLEGHRRKLMRASPVSTIATAMHAIPSPRPIAPMPSLVVALTLTGAPSASREARLHLGPVRRQLRLLADQAGVDVERRCPGACRAPCAAGRASRRRASARRRAGSASPRSPSPAAPSSASITAWVSTSASECPARPRSCSISTPPRISDSPSTKRCES